DGRFYFKLLAAQGALLLQSRGFVSPQEAGAAIALLQQQGASALKTLAAQLEPIHNEDVQAVEDALATLAHAASAVGQG
ncbi:MAG: DUF1508 domain-containing protein, partial [Oxalobacteraceae bacterium]